VPAVNSLTLWVPWPPRHCAATGFIASAHENLLALCLGNCYHDDWRHLPGCYLVLNTRAKSVAVVPPLPAAVRVDSSHCYPIGSAGVAVRRTDVHDDADDRYLLAELYRHTDRDDFPTNNPAPAAARVPVPTSGYGRRWCSRSRILMKTSTASISMLERCSPSQAPPFAG